jgi:hypothetical protein
LKQLLKSGVIWIALLTLAIAVLYLIIGWQQGFAIYWLFVLYHLTSRWLGIIIIPILFILILLSLFCQAIRDRETFPITPLIAVIIVAFANFLACFATLPQAQNYTDNGSINLNEHIYRISTMRVAAIHNTASYVYNLYQCDSLGIICNIIFEKEYPITPDDYEVRTIELIPDPAANTVALEINDEIVYTHQL